MQGKGVDLNLSPKQDLRVNSRILRADFWFCRGWVGVDFPSNKRRGQFFYDGVFVTTGSVIKGKGVASLFEPPRINQGAMVAYL